MIGIVRGLITLALMILFIAYALWAWSNGPKKEFEETARLPLEEDSDHPPDCGRPHGGSLGQNGSRRS